MLRLGKLGGGHVSVDCTEPEERHAGVHPIEDQDGLPYQRAEASIPRTLRAPGQVLWSIR